jgi:N-acetylmuramoyl-L-alanine amidase
MRLCLLMQALLLIISPLAAAAQKQAGSYAGETAYQQAADQCHRLVRNSAAGQSRTEWLKAVAELERVYQQYPKSRTAPACLHLAAKMRISMYQRFRQPADQDQAVALFHNVVTLFPQSSEAANALYAIAEIAQINGNLRDAAKTYYKLTKNYPFSPRTAQAEEKLRQLTAIAESLTARKNGRRPPPLVRAQQQKKTVSRSQPVKPAPVTSPEPEWELIDTEPETAAAQPSSRSASSSALREKKAVSAPAKPDAPPPTAAQWQEWPPVSPPPAAKPADNASPSLFVPREMNISPPAPVLRQEKTESASHAQSAAPPTAGQWQEWQPVSPPPAAKPADNASTSLSSQQKRDRHTPSASVLTEKDLFSPPQTTRLPAASAPSKPPEHAAAPTITFSELKIAEPDSIALPAKKEKPLEPAAVSEQAKPKSASVPKAAKVEMQPAPPEEKKSFWKRMLPDFMFGGGNEKEENKTEQAAVQSAEAGKAQKSVKTTPAVAEKKAEPISVRKAMPSVQEKKPEKAAPKVAFKLEKTSETGRIIVAPLQIAEPPPAAKKEPAPAVHSVKPEKAAEVAEQPSAEKKAAQPLVDRREPAAVSSARPEKISRPKPKKTAEAPLPDLLLIQHWSSDRYSRVAVNASEPTEYHVELPDRSSGKPGTLHIDFERISATPAALTPVVLKNGLVKSIYTKLSRTDAVRVSLELAEAADCKVFSLNDPFRVVVDLRSLAEPEPEKTVAAANLEGEKAVPAQEKKNTEEPVLKAQSKVKPVEAEKLTLAQQLGLGIRRIVIDPGHGGKDTGAVAFGLKEKDIVLKVAKRVRKILKRGHYEVFLTREKDVFIPLEERTAIANTKGADLFLSIHVNAHPKSWVRGVETFYLNLAANPEAMRVAALENATSSRSMSEMENILTDLMKNTKIKESSQLAEFIQTSMAEGLRRYKIRSLGVKKAPFYVLIGAQMPAALAEISFITNEKEAKLLKDDRYLQTIAEQIAAGVTAYIEHRRTAATAALHLAAEEDRM